MFCARLMESDLACAGPIGNAACGVLVVEEILSAKKALRLLCFYVSARFWPQRHGSR